MIVNKLLAIFPFQIQMHWVFVFILPQFKSAIKGKDEGMELRIQQMPNGHSWFFMLHILVVTGFNLSSANLSSLGCNAQGRNTEDTSLLTQFVCLFVFFSPTRFALTFSFFYRKKNIQIQRGSKHLIHF